jgi:hypothetical protein
MLGQPVAPAPAVSRRDRFGGAMYRAGSVTYVPKPGCSNQGAIWPCKASKGIHTKNK